MRRGRAAATVNFSAGAMTFHKHAKKDTYLPVTTTGSAEVVRIHRHGFRWSLLDS